MTTKIFLCGDIVNKNANKDFVDKDLQQIINKCDISICNFEAPIKSINMQPIPKAGPHVFQAKESITFLKKAGFNILSLANNHIYDYGDVALSATIGEIRKNNLEYIGAGLSFDEAYNVKVIEKNGIKIGLISACEAEFGSFMEREKRGGYAWINHSIIETNIRKLKKIRILLYLLLMPGLRK